MTTPASVDDEVFPKHSHKTFALVELMRGTSPQVGKGPEDTVFAFPIVLLWEISLTLGVTLSIFLFSLLKQAPLEEIANPLVTTNPAKAPWYFMGLQEMLEHMHPLVAGVLVPTVLVLFLLALPYLDPSRADTGVWFASPRGKRVVGLAALYALVVVPLLIVLDNTFSLREALRGSVPEWLAQQVLPAAILFVVVALPAVMLRLRQGNPREMLLLLFTVMLTSAVVLTVCGFLFRGPGFKLYWPWDMPNGYNPWSGL
jgi:menaquinol-cytochrome c reductase cytochrome b/c subunit